MYHTIVFIFPNRHWHGWYKIENITVAYWTLKWNEKVSQTQSHRLTTISKSLPLTVSQLENYINTIRVILRDITYPPCPPHLCHVTWYIVDNCLIHISIQQLSKYLIVLVLSPNCVAVSNCRGLCKSISIKPPLYIFFQTSISQKVRGTPLCMPTIINHLCGSIASQCECVRLLC